MQWWGCRFRTRDELWEKWRTVEGPGAGPVFTQCGELSAIVASHADPTALMKNFFVLGRLLFALAVIASGLLQILRQDFIRLVPKATAAWLPLPRVWAVVTGAALVAIGVAIAADRARRPAALGLAALLIGVFLMYVPEVVANPGAGFVWTNPCKTLALLGAALVLVELPADSSGFSRGAGAKQLGLLCAVCFGIFLVVCGVQHFVYAGFVTEMVPAWLPGRSFWTYFTAVALMAGGVGINVRPTARIAALWAGLMIFLWVVLLHVPRAVARWPDAGEMAGIFEALALSGTAFLLAATGTNAVLTPATGPSVRVRNPG